MPRKKAVLYTPNGEPTRIRCYMIKREPKPADYITVVFTHAHLADYPKGTVPYRAMSGAPFHPMGYGQWVEAERPGFKPGGSRVKFSELPPDCQEVVMSDYKELWERN